MKKLLFFGLLMISLSAYAQTKVGTVDVDFILSKMPELSSVQTEANAYGKGLEEDLQKKITAYEAAIQKYQAEEVSMTVAQKKTAQDSILAMETDINKFQQNGSKLINLKNDELMGPLYEKAGIALEKVAKAQGYTQILQRNSSLVYSDNTYDITLDILKELGIEVKEGN